MMLALAIIAIVFGLTTALMVSIKDSFVMTYNLNDSSDYAVLYGYGIENSVLAKVSKKESATWKIDTYTDDSSGMTQNCVLMCGGNVQVRRKFLDSPFISYTYDRR